MPYFSGANVKVSIKNTYEDSLSTYNHLEECAGLSYSLSNSQQPVYGYASNRFDAMLPGREIIQGNFLINYTEPNYMLKKLGFLNNYSGTISYNGLVGPAFNLKIEFLERSKSKAIIIENCYIMGVGQTAQISDQPIIDEYSFIGRSLSYEM